MNAMIYINFKLLKNKSGKFFYLFELLLFFLGGGIAYYGQEKIFTTFDFSISSSLKEKTSLFIYLYLLNAFLFAMITSFLIGISRQKVKIGKSKQSLGNNALILYVQSGRSMILYYFYQYLSILLLGLPFLIGYQLYSMFAYQIDGKSTIIGLLLFISSSFLLIQFSNLFMQLVKDPYTNMFAIMLIFIGLDRIPLTSNGEIHLNQITSIFFITILFLSFVLTITNTLTIRLNYQSHIKKGY